MKILEMLKINKKAFTALMVGSILAILIGSIMLIVTYTVLSTIFGIGQSAFLNTTAASSGATGTLSVMNTSMFANFTVITQALNIVGISLIVAGIAGIIYTLMGVAGMTGGGIGGARR